MTLEAPRSGAGRSGALAAPLDYLAGAWDLRRRCWDRRLELEGRFAGTATVAADATGADYLEDGVLEFGEHRGPASRALRYWAAGPGVIAVHFADGRLFHHLVLSGAGHDAEHPCGPDRYAGRFVVVGDHEWHATWRVEGPGKSLLLEAVYRRVLPGRPAPVGPRPAVASGRS